MKNLRAGKRQSSIELLRIVAMLMVLISHYSFHSFYVAGEGYTSIINIFNRLLLQIANTGSLGVDVFIIISGYCMINSTFKAKKMVELLAQVWFYSILIFACAVAFKWEEITFDVVLKSIFPTMFGTYWFFTAYIVLYMLSPYINRLMKAESSTSARRKNATMIMLMLVLWSFFPTFTTANWNGTELPLFVMLYCIGAYLRLYPENIVRQHSGWLVIGGGISWVTFAVICNILGIWMPVFSIHVTYFYSKSSILTILLATCLVSHAGKSERLNSSVINRVASNVFSVYLLTDNSLIRYQIWDHWFHSKNYAESPVLILHMGIVSVILFTISITIEEIRKISYGNVVEFVINKYEELFRGIGNKFNFKF